MSIFNFFKPSNDAFRRSRGTFKQIKTNSDYQENGLIFPKSKEDRSFFDFFMNLLLDVFFFNEDHKPNNRWEKYKKPIDDTSTCSNDSGNLMKSHRNEANQEILSRYYLNNRAKFSRSEWRQMRDKSYYLGAWYEIDKEEDINTLNKIREVNQELTNGFSTMNNSKEKHLPDSLGVFNNVPNYYSDKYLISLIKRLTKKP
jgi:hypothetical protein